MFVEETFQILTAFDSSGIIQIKNDIQLGVQRKWEASKKLSSVADARWFLMKKDDAFLRGPSYFLFLFFFNERWRRGEGLKACQMNTTTLLADGEGYFQVVPHSLRSHKARDLPFVENLHSITSSKDCSHPPPFNIHPFDAG